MGITGQQNGIDLVRGTQGFAVLDDGAPLPAAIVAGSRIGIRVGLDFHWRFHVAESRYVSGPAR